MSKIFGSVIVRDVRVLLWPAWLIFSRLFLLFIYTFIYSFFFLFLINTFLIWCARAVGKQNILSRLRAAQSVEALAFVTSKKEQIIARMKISMRVRGRREIAENFLRFCAQRDRPTRSNFRLLGSVHSRWSSAFLLPLLFCNYLTRNRFIVVHTWSYGAIAQHDFSRAIRCNHCGTWFWI